MGNKTKTTNSRIGELVEGKAEGWGNRKIVLSQEDVEKGRSLRVGLSVVSVEALI